MPETEKPILVVDDEPKIVEVVRSYLENAGYRVIEAHDGEQALDLFRKADPVLMILDLMLPDITGEEICRIIRKTSDIPIIMLTAKVEEADILKGLDIGADDYVTKPFSPRQLVARVGAILRRVSGANAASTAPLSFNNERQDTIRKRMSADVAHELRTPLATLQSHMEAMIDGIWEPDAARLKSCHEEIVRIGRLVGDLEKLARFEGGNLHLDIKEFDLSELISNIIRNFENDFRNKGIELFYEPGKILIHADRDKISQVLVNLLSNALKYTPEGGRVEVWTKDENNVIEIAVRDNGRGIPEDDLPYIFERFYRADKSRNRLTGGSGIGLTIAKTLVETHHGRIRVKSRLNEGTEFLVILPKKVEPA